MSRRSLPENGNAVFSFRGIEDAGERTAHSWSWVSRSMPRLCHISRLSAMFDSPSCEGGIPPLGHAHICPSRSVSNNYHATNHQPIRNKGAKKETSSDCAEWRTRCRCASVASPSRHIGHTLRMQNDDGAEFVVERGALLYSVSSARGMQTGYNPASGGLCGSTVDTKGHRIRNGPETPQEYLRYDCVVDTG